MHIKGRIRYAQPDLSGLQNLELTQELIEEVVYPVTRYKPDGDKLMRLHSQTATMENGFVYLPREVPWLAEYLHEITTFPNGKHDDQVDSTSQELAWTKQGSSASAWIESMRKQAEAGITHVQNGGDLMAAYSAAFYATSKPVLHCAGCGKTITDSTRISDGVDCWHIGCQGKVMR